MTDPEQHVLYEFGACRLSPGRRELSSTGGKVVTLSPKAFDALAYLVKHPGTLVTKSALMEAIWPNVVVEDNTLSHVISAIRHALGDDAREPRYIAVHCRC